LAAENKWVQDREIGQPFKAERLNSMAPSTKARIEKYPGGGMVKGSGPVSGPCFF
jgi:hypothetical protein